MNKMEDEKSIKDVMSEIHVTVNAFDLPDVSKCTTKYLVISKGDLIKNYYFLLSDGSFFHIQYRFMMNKKWTLYNYKTFSKEFIDDITGFAALAKSLEQNKNILHLKEVEMVSKDWVTGKELNRFWNVVENQVVHIPEVTIKETGKWRYRQAILIDRPEDAKIYPDCIKNKSEV